MTQFRHAKIQDIPAIVALDKSSNLTSWQHSEYINCFNNKSQSLFVLELCSGCIIGVLALSHILDEAEVLQLVIAKHAQGQGHGSALLNYGLKYLLKKFRTAQVFLEVREDNQSAISLYTKLGFVSVGRRSNYYQIDNWGLDALVMLYSNKLGL